ncbi:MAG: hypothetical protein H0X12_14410 [Nocardioides sp.]|nr:hypothetical protein [Nocardioides sp.]
MVILPAMAERQADSWQALLDLYERLSEGWTLVGGQMVHLHCAERGYSPLRPTDDADMVLDIKANAEILLEFTTVLQDEMGFEADGITANGKQHRWKGTNSKASIDVLIPANVGERLPLRKGATGSQTIQTPGGIQALHRTEVVAVTAAGREGFVRRPNLVGALIIKAAAHEVISDPLKGRHRADFATLAAMVSASDFRDEELSTSERKRLRAMITRTRADRAVMGAHDDAEDGLERLERRLDR